MLIFLYGTDSYRRIQKLNEIVEAFRKKQSNLSHERFDLNNNEEFVKFKTFTSNRSIFDPVRLAVLDNFVTTPRLKELKEILKINHKNEDLIIILNSATKPTGFTTLVKAPTKVQDFSALKGVKIAGFIKETAKKLGISVDASAAKALVQTFGGNTWGIVTELERMALAKREVATLSIHKPADNFFQLINTVKYGRRLPERLIALEILLSDHKDEPAKIFNILAYRLRSESEANLLADYDVAVKSGKLEYEEVLLDYVLD